LLLPVRLIEEANPDWRLLSWVLALLVASYSLVVMAMTGGGSWTRHFAFPVLFPLVAVPWPVQVENVVTQSLAHGVATAAVEIAGWIGVAAFQLGSVIQLHNGFVGVDDACSGVKTLQAGIMVALFLGEVRSLTALQRVLLLIGGCSWVFLCNVARATTLVGIAAQRGFDALHAAHDLVGTIVLIAGMGGLVGLAWLFRSRKSEEEARTPSRRLADFCQARLVGTAAAVTWLIAIFVFTEFWYRPNERQLLLRPVWSVEWPEDAPGFAEEPIADATRAILRYSSATSAAWLSDRGGERWWGFFARWEPQRTAQGMVRSIRRKFVSRRPAERFGARGRRSSSRLQPANCRSASTNSSRNSNRCSCLSAFRKTRSRRTTGRRHLSGMHGAVSARRGTANGI